MDTSTADKFSKNVVNVVIFLSAIVFVAYLIFQRQLKTNSAPVVDIQKTPIETREKVLDEKLNKAESFVLVGRIQSVNAPDQSFMFRDETLPLLIKIKKDFIARPIVTNNATLFVHEEHMNDPHTKISFAYLRPGQYVGVYVMKGDIENLNEVYAQKVVLYSFMPVSI